jgi:hypothetical protein
MSKESKVVEKENKSNDVADKAKEAIQTLRVQLVEHQRQAEHHTTMSVKAQGALEVLLQLHPQQEEENK